MKREGSKFSFGPRGGGHWRNGGGGDFFLILPATRMRRGEIRISGISVFKPSTFIFVSNVAWRLLLVSFFIKRIFFLLPHFPSCLPSFFSNEQIANCSSRPPPPPPPPPPRSSKCRREYTIKKRMAGKRSEEKNLKPPQEHKDIVVEQVIRFLVVYRGIQLLTKLLEDLKNIAECSS